VRAAQVKAGLAVNRELVLVYWHIGHRILPAQRREGWGAKVVDRLAADLGRAFRQMRGFSPRNLKYMRAFAEAWPDEPIVQQIESDLYGRRGKALTNFDRLLPAPQSELAEQRLKDPYNLDFLGLSDDVVERELERGLLEHLRSFLLEPGVGFAFVGSQYHLEVGGRDFHIDLLFYHLRLRRYVVFELKTGEFKPESAGKMGFYLAAADDLVRKPPDEPSSGIILRKTRNRFVVGYALRYVSKPMAPSAFGCAQRATADRKEGAVGRSRPILGVLDVLVVQCRIEGPGLA